MGDGEIVKEMVEMRELVEEMMGESEMDYRDREGDEGDSAGDGTADSKGKERESCMNHYISII